MTDETEAVGLALCQNALGPKQCPCAEKGVFNCADTYPGNQARVAITALDKHRIERAGEVEKALRFHGRYGAESNDTMNRRKWSEREEAAATIAALRAEMDRLEDISAHQSMTIFEGIIDKKDAYERGKLDGVRAGIEASARAVEGEHLEDPATADDDAYDAALIHAAEAIRSLDPATILAQHKRTHDTLADSDGDDGA